MALRLLIFFCFYKTYANNFQFAVKFSEKSNFNIYGCTTKLPSFILLTPGELRLPRPSLCVERGKAQLAGLWGEWGNFKTPPISIKNQD